MDDLDDDDEESKIELEHIFAMYELLMKRRPILLNSVLLRQNPHNAHEWLNRVKLFEGEPEKVGFKKIIVYNFLAANRDIYRVRPYNWSQTTSR